MQLFYIFPFFLIKILDLSAQLYLIRRLKTEDKIFRFIAMVVTYSDPNQTTEKSQWIFFLLFIKEFLIKFHLYPFSSLGLTILLNIVTF